MAFELTTSGQERLREFLARCHDARAALLPALWLVQEEAGFISDEAVEHVARSLDVPVAEVFGVVTFYDMFKRRRLGRHHIQVCTNICCWLRGSMELLEYLKARLGIDVGGITEDGNFSLGTVPCIGACGGAPAMMIDLDYFEEMTPARVDEVLRSLKKDVAEPFRAP